MPKIVASVIPANRVVPMERRAPEPAPVASTMGSVPRNVVNAVINTGRNRSYMAFVPASTMLIPRPSRLSRANSTMRMAFLLAMPTSMISPSWA